MKTNTLLVFIIFLPILTFAQERTGLSKMLWDRVQNCFDLFEDMDDDGEKDFNKIDDSRNGYLKIWGGFPTCGCECSSTVGAYRGGDGKYTFLQLDEGNCDFQIEMSSNRELKEVLPEGFGLQDFLYTSMDTKLVRPAFVLKVEIPRVGTDTKVSLVLVPFGLGASGSQGLTYGHRLPDGYVNTKHVGRLAGLAKNMKDPQTMDHILAGNFKRISNEDKTLLDEVMVEDSEVYLKTPKEVQDWLLYLKKVYEIQKGLKYDAIILGWDRQKSRFYIKSKQEKGPKQEQTFREFLSKGFYWGFMC